MGGVPRKLENVPERNAQMFDQFPWRMVSSGRYLASKSGRQTRDCFLKIHVSLCLGEQSYQLFP